MNNRAPFLLALPFFLGGVIIGEKTQLISPYLIFSLAAILVLFYFLDKIISFKTHFLGISICILALFFGLFIVPFHKTNQPKLPIFQTTYIGNIVEPPSFSKNKFKCIVNIDGYFDSTAFKKINFKMLTFLEADSNTLLYYGDKIAFKTISQEIQNNGNPSEFDFKMYMNKKRIFHSSFVQKNNWIVTEHNKGNRIVIFALKTRDYLLSIYKKSKIDGQEFAVLSALTLGYKAEIDTETRQRYSQTGAMHILAVSGLHVGVIFMILNYLLAFLNKKKHLFFIKSIIIIFFLWFFALIAGLAPSVCRAALMFSLILIASIIQRKTSTYNIIATSVFMLLTIEPTFLYEVGFQLSYSAVVSIIMFQPKIYKLFVIKNKILDKIWTLISVSIAAQVGTMPLGFYYFHQFPNYFFITNIFAVPLATIILYLAVVLLSISWIPYISTFFAFALKYTVKLLNFLIWLVDSIPFATTKNIFFNLPQIILMYIFIFSFFGYIVSKQKNWLYCSIFSLLFFVCFELSLTYKLTNQSLFAIYNIKGNSLINYIDKKNNISISSDSITPYSRNIVKALAINNRSNNTLFFKYDTIQNTNIQNIFYINNQLLWVKNKSILIVNKPFKIKDYNKKFFVDYILIEKNPKIDIIQFTQAFCFKKIIISSNNKNKYRKQIIEILQKNKIDYFDIQSQGAFLVNLNK